MCSDLFFFFSSRRRHTRCSRDWSSDVCSSDLEHAPALRAAGLHRVTVSLDTLRPQRFAALTRRNHHAQVLEGIAALPRAGFSGTKLDTVVIRGVNDDELADLIEFGRRVPAEVRFIECMAVG